MKAVSLLLIMTVTLGCVEVSYRQAGDRALQRQDFAGAIVAYSKALSRNPHDFGAAGNKALAHEQLGETDAALRGYSRVVSLDADRVWPRLCRANLYLKTGDLPRAEQDIEYLMGDSFGRLSNHNKVLALALFARLLSLKGQHDLAIGQVARAIELSRQSPRLRRLPHYRDLLYEMSRLHYKTGAARPALAWYKLYTAELGRNRIALGESDHFNMAIMSHLAGDKEQAYALLSLVSGELQTRACEILGDYEFAATKLQKTLTAEGTGGSG